MLTRGGVRVDPPLRKEFVAIFSPEFRTAVDGVGANKNPGTLGDMGICYNGVTDGLPECGGYSREETKNLLADTVE